MDQPTASTSEAAPPPTAPVGVPVAGQPLDPSPQADSPGFRTRGRARRRVRFLRKARELAYRDLGGLVFTLHRFGHRNDALVMAKLTTLGKIDTELCSLENALEERQPVTVLREAGITACPRCAAIHSGEDRFCPNCGLSVSRHVDLPIGGASGAPPAGVANSGAPGAGAPGPAPIAAPAGSPTSYAPPAAAPPAPAPRRCPPPPRRPPPPCPRRRRSPRTRRRIPSSRPRSSVPPQRAGEPCPDTPARQDRR